MSTQESTRSGRSRVVLGIVAAVVVVLVVLLVLALTGALSGLFAKEVQRTVRSDVDASGLVATLASYPDSFRGGTLPGGQADLDVQIDQAAIRGGDPATIVLRTYSCPGADGRPAATRLVIEGADPEHLAPRPATAGGGVALTGAFEVVAVTPVAPGVAPECRIDLAAR
ncbi:MAG: hypothetical protein AVDCRST_MAG54-4267 [uncultured Actinomycetospora sp.]|uniref:Uncharacterized protein n=1 Tax=uncultured Actinomycetospora sp. TaxID=1135996 RepID=A0A6J4JVP0_9PSEU|nr:MAG: hypothetical protein AVDCRST_MAG54-4267 [uncultured Actinomycetospora sp.]